MIRKSGGQFAPAGGGQFAPARGGQFDRHLHHFSISSVNKEISSFVFRSFKPEKTSCSNKLQYSLY